MLEQMVGGVMDKQLAQQYPHLKLPAVVFARVISATKLGETYEYVDIEVEHDATCGSFRGKITFPWYEYTLTVVDRFGNPDPKYPELPGASSREQFQSGAIVAIGLAYGDITPAIIGEVRI